MVVHQQSKFIFSFYQMQCNHLLHRVQCMANSTLNIIAAFYHYKSPTRHRTIEPSIRVSNAFVEAGRQSNENRFWRKAVAVRLTWRRAASAGDRSLLPESSRIFTFVQVNPFMETNVINMCHRSTGVQVHLQIARNRCWLVVECATFVNLFFAADTHASFLAFFVGSAEQR